MSSGILRRRISDNSSAGRRKSVRQACADSEGASTVPRACFDQRADTYAKHAVVQRAMAAWLAEWLEPAESMRELSALEVGAGDGCFTAYLTNRVNRLIAIDEAQRMVERGRSAVPSARWQVCDAWSLDEAPVDRLYSASLLQWCRAPREVLAHWRDVVKPGGRMLHGFYVTPTLAEWETLAGSSSGLTWRSADEWDAAFREAGWRVVRQEVEQRSVRFDSALALLRFFHKTGAATPMRSGAGKLRRLLREYERRFAWSANVEADPAPATTSGVVSTWAFFRIEVERPA